MTRVELLEAGWPGHLEKGLSEAPGVKVVIRLEVLEAGCPVGSGETSWNGQKIGAEPNLVAFHI